MYLPCQHYTRQLARSSVNLSRRRTRGFSYRHELGATLYLHAIRLWFGRKQDVSCSWHSRQFLRGHPFRFQFPSPRSCCHHIRHGGHADSTRMDRLARFFLRASRAHRMTDLVSQRPCPLYCGGGTRCSPRCDVEIETVEFDSIGTPVNERATGVHAVFPGAIDEY